MDIFVQHKLTRVLIASDEIIIIVEGVLMCKLESHQLAEAVVSFLSTYYLLDVSYPHSKFQNFNIRKKNSKQAKKFLNLTIFRLSDI